MLCILSPAKSLNEAASFPATIKPSTPALWSQAKTLAVALRELTQNDIKSLMDVSDKIAALNHMRFQHFPDKLTKENAKPAMYLFTGDVYSGFDIASLAETHLPALNQRVRILSGLYGLLRPFDLTYPYRLEMGTRFANEKGKDLYAFWGSTIAETLNQHAKEIGTDILINLASNEYSKAVDRKALKLQEIMVQFKEQKGNQLKVIGLMAKRARGMMARFIVEQAPNTIKDLRKFNAAGYQFDRDISSDHELVFIRKS